MSVRHPTGHIGIAVLAASAVLTSYAHAEVSPKMISVQVDALTRVVTGRRGAEAPVDRVTLTHRISYADLDLTMQSGVQALRRRVAETARLACEQLERLYPRHSESLARCTHQAIDDTEPEIVAAVDAAERQERGE